MLPLKYDVNMMGIVCIHRHKSRESTHDVGQIATSCGPRTSRTLKFRGFLRGPDLGCDLLGIKALNNSSGLKDTITLGHVMKTH